MTTLENDIPRSSASGAFASRYEADHQALRPVVIGLTAQAQRVVLGSLEQRGLSDEISRELVPH